MGLINSGTENNSEVYFDEGISNLDQNYVQKYIHKIKNK